jgi:hypothetical protein
MLATNTLVKNPVWNFCVQAALYYAKTQKVIRVQSEDQEGTRCNERSASGCAKRTATIFVASVSRCPFDPVGGT